jgi:hypothetical protein
MLKSLTLSAAIVACTYHSAFAQGQVDVTGQWQCQIGARAHNNDPIQAHQWQFVLMLNPNGQFQAQGTYYSPSIGQTEQMQAFGSWQLQNSQQGPMLATNGTWTRSIGGSMQLPVYLYVRDARTMAYQKRDQYTEEVYLCQR